MSTWLIVLMMIALHEPSAADDEMDLTPRASEIAGFQNACQLTSAKQFVKAGESYISKDGSMVIFQAVPVPPEGEQPDLHYGMYLGDLVTHEDSSPRWTLENIRLISPENAANTCGWFHPTEVNRVIFASTIEAPDDAPAPGYQRDSRDYRWEFPPEMRIVEARIDGAMPPALRLIEGDEKHYQAECSISPDGRHLLYTSLESGDGDIFVTDLETGNKVDLVMAPGYDGGPFFSPDGKRICYRSDRKKDDHLQIFVSELSFDESGAITGIDREIQVTDNEFVNWAPFWHSDGRSLVYATSEEGHYNYEIYIVDADPGDLEAGRPTRYGTRRSRVTNSRGFDGLPAFNEDSSLMIWTSKRNEDSSQLYIADFPDPQIFLEHKTNQVR